jgi:hypothetical protein
MRIVRGLHRIAMAVLWQFVRTVSPSTSIAPAAVALILHYKWMRCVALSDHRDAFLMTANAWSQALEAKRADVKRVTLHASPLANTTTVAHALAAILAAKVRVILVFGPSAVLRTIALEASVSGMARAGWVWISDALCAQINAQDETAEVRLLTRMLCALFRLLIFGVD